MTTVRPARHAGPAEPDIAPVPDASGHFVVGAVGIAEEGGASEAPGVAYGGRFAPEALMAALDELTAAYEQARKDPVFRADLDTLFGIVQLYSYPGDYLAEEPSIERIAETLDKFEEDVLSAKYPAVRGERRAVMRFGEPILAREHGPRDAAAQLTRLLQERVQGLLNEMGGK